MKSYLRLVSMLAGIAACTGVAAAKEPVKLECEVVDQNGKPAPGAEVYLCAEYPMTENFLPGPIMASGRTDERGLFHTEVEVQDYWEVLPACVCARSGAAVGFCGVGLTPPWPRSYQAKVTLQPGLDLRLKVLQPDDQPAAHLKVWVDRCTQSRSENNRSAYLGWVEPPLLPGDFWNATTDEAGECTLHGFPKGAHVHVVHGDDRFAQPIGQLNILLDGLTPGAELHTLKLSPAGVIKGRVVTPQGAPVAGAGLMLTEQYPYVAAYSAEGRTDAEGRFVFPRTPAAKYKLRIYSPPAVMDEWFGPEELPVEVRAGGETDLGELKVSQTAIVTARVVDQSSGKEIEEPLVYRFAAGTREVRYRIRRVMPKGYKSAERDPTVTVSLKGGERREVAFLFSPLTDKDRVSGVVLGTDGTPAAGVWVSIFDGAYLEGDQAKTDSEGKFRLQAPRRPGAGALFAYEEGELKDKALSEPCWPKAGEVVTLRLKKEGFASVSGQVCDEEAHPIPGAVVQWRAPRVSGMVNSFPASATTDEKGNYSFPRLWHGDYDFSVSAKGWGMMRRPQVKVAEGQAVEHLDFTLRRQKYTLRVKVTDDAGAALPTMKVYLSGNEQGQREGVTDEHGEFAFGKLAPGEVEVRAWVDDPKLSSAEKTVNASAGSVTLVMRQRRGEVAGVVRDEAGRPLAGARVYSDEVSGTTDEQGKFKLRQLALEGWCTVQATVADQIQGERMKQVRVRAGAKDVVVEVPGHSEPASPTTPVEMLGKNAPPIEVGTWFNSADLGATPAPGKVRILDFWGLECAPCIHGLPKVAEFWKAHQQEVLEVIAIMGFYPEEEVREFLQKHPTYTFPVARRVDGDATGRAYDIHGIPTYVVIDKSGKIVSYGHDWAEATKAALKALEEKRSS